MNRWLPAVFAVLVTTAALYHFRGEAALALMRWTVERNMAAGAMDRLPDGLHVVLCGAGSPMPDAARGGPCTAIVAGGRLFLFDAGSGAARTLTRMGFQTGGVERVFLTHFHSDHIDGLGELMLQRWVGGAHASPLAVHGPEGVAAVVEGFNAAYRADAAYRTAHHGAAIAPPAGAGGVAIPFRAGTGGRLTIVDGGGLTIEAFAVAHAPVEPAAGYRIAYKGRVVVLSGDTRASAAVEEAARNADVLVHEALSPELVGIARQGAAKAGRARLAKILHDIVDYHTTPEQAAEIAARARVRVLLLTHIVPPLPLPALEGPFLGRAEEIFSGTVRVGRDGDVVSLPAQTSGVRIENRL